MSRFATHSLALKKDAAQLLAEAEALIRSGELAVHRSALLLRRARSLLPGAPVPAGVVLTWSAAR